MYIFNSYNGGIIFENICLRAKGGREGMIFDALGGKM